MPRNKHKKIKAVKFSTIEEELEYLGFETIPCPYCSSPVYNGYHKKGDSKHEHKKLSTKTFKDV